MHTTHKRDFERHLEEDRGIAAFFFWTGVALLMLIV